MILVSMMTIDEKESRDSEIPITGKESIFSLDLIIFHFHFSMAEIDGCIFFCKILS